MLQYSCSHFQETKFINSKKLNIKNWIKRLNESEMPDPQYVSYNQHWPISNLISTQLSIQRVGYAHQCMDLRFPESSGIPEI